MSQTKIYTTRKLEKVAKELISENDKTENEELGNGIWKVFYRDAFLGFFNETQLRNKEKSIRLETNLV